MRLFSLMATALFALAPLSLHAADGWLQSYDAAVAQAKSQGRVVFAALINNSKDAKKLETEVFANPEFKDYAARHLVLLKVDFDKTEGVSSEAKGQNNELRSKVGARTLPASVVLDAEGNVLGKWEGYAGGGPARTIAKVEACRP